MRICASLLLSLALFPAHARGQSYSIDWFTVAGGGLRSSSTNYTLNGTVGQPAPGAMASGNYALVGGFWSFSATQTPVGQYDGINLTDPAQALADLDGDGLSNLMEYGLGTNPRNPADAQAGIMTSMVQTNGRTYVTLRFKRRKTTPGLVLQYIPEVSSDGQTWFSDSAHLAQVNVTSLDDQFDWVTVQDLTPTTFTTPRLIRLRLVEN